MEQRAFTLKVTGIFREVRTQVGIFPIAPANEVPSVIEKFSGVWDTGATNTAIASSVVKKLGLTPITFAPVATGGGQVLAPVYLINVVLPNNVLISTIQVTELKELNNCDVLVGMDIISSGDFALTHANGEACFSFRLPPHKHIDFVPESNQFNRKLLSRVGKSKKNLPTKKRKKR